MKSLLVGTLAFYFLSVALAQDAVCSVKESTDLDVVIRDGDTFKYKTSPKRKYGDNIECLVTYELDASCAEMELRCKKINIKNKDVEDCTDGDKLVITNDDEETETVCGKKKKFVFKSSSNMVVEFTSDGKKRGAGAKGCVVTCTKAASAATATAAPTTAAPTTAAPTTAAPTTAAPTTEPVPCVNCTTEDAQPCQFPFIWQNITFTSCTMLNDDKPWCATQVDSLRNFIAGPNSYGWGYCTPSCPSEEGYPASGDGPACDVQTTGLPFPEECAERLARSHKNILFLGNSYTHGNDLPGMVKNLASAAGKSASTTMVAPGGQTLAGHVSGGSLNTIKNSDWDVVVIQDQSQRPSFGPGYVYHNILSDVLAIEEAIRSSNKCTLPLFFMTWGKRDGDIGNCNNGATALCTFEGVQEQLTNAYSTFAYVSQPAAVAPAGEAWAAYSNRNALFSSDGSHASSMGTYLTACTMLESIWPDVSCVGNSYRPVSDAANLQAVAHQTMSRQSWAWPEAGERPCSYCLP